MNNVLTRQEKIADTREPKVLTEPLIDYGWLIRKLDYADYAFWTPYDEPVGITRKTISDLLGSFVREFGDQLHDMTCYYKYRIILVEGNWRAVAEKHKIVTERGVEHANWNMVWNFLQTWQDKGFSLQLTFNHRHTIERLNSLYSYYQKPIHTGISRRLEACQ